MNTNPAPVRPFPGTSNIVLSSGASVERTVDEIDAAGGIDQLLDALDSHRGLYLCSTTDYPGRYRIGSRGFVDPPLAITTKGRSFAVQALNGRGEVLLPALAQLTALPAIESMSANATSITGSVRSSDQRFTEEMRSRQHSVFSVIRAILQLFKTDQDPYLGLYGAFGYDLVSQFENIQSHAGCDSRNDIVLYLPDELILTRDDGSPGYRIRYEFHVGDRTTAGMARLGSSQPSRLFSVPKSGSRDHQPGQFAATVRQAKKAFQRGDLFEVVASQTFPSPCVDSPSTLFKRLVKQNPAPYGALINLGDGEHLVSASPEMYVRVTGSLVESCPISGTVTRGRDALEDHDQTLSLLNSHKDESELTMCTDVDRNDKSRICVPGTVRVVGRRQVELYSRVIHTVDHVQGELRPDFDAIDAFLAHMWAVTVTGAPKLWAMRFIERNERSPRGWYGGAFGYLGVDGNVNTGLTIRTLRLKNGTAEVRAGSTLLIDSDPDEEERESELKAAAFLDVVQHGAEPAPHHEPVPSSNAGVRVLLIDHEDSFVHTLAGYFQQAGANVTTIRAPIAREVISEQMERLAPDIVVLSPGPGSPSHFDVAATVEIAIEQSIPIFGVCLGLQGIAEYFGGWLDTLPYPVHGKSSTVHVLGGRLFDGIPTTFTAGRYHSLHADWSSLPDDLLVTAESDGIVMAIEHRTLPIAAVQFHPESIMTSADSVGLRIIENVVEMLGRQDQRAGRHRPIQCSA